MRAVVRAVQCALLLLALLAAPCAAPASAADGPTAVVSGGEAVKGGSVTVTGAGWRPGALLTLLVCGQNMIGGTGSCANADGRTVTAAADGTFRRSIPVPAPPKPCPCVVHVATVMGTPAAADAALTISGHPSATLPRQEGGERLSVLEARLQGGDGLLTWFGAPPQRTLVLTVGNLGTTPARDPVFRLGTSHGVLAPSWEDRRWRGTVAAGRTVRVALDVELATGAYGDYRVSLEYDGKLLVEEPWDVSRPWGVTLFWVLLCVVVPAGVYRIGMAVVDRIRPPQPRNPRTRTGKGAPGPVRAPALPWSAPRKE